MASRIKAINTLRPRLQRGRTAEFDEVVGFVRRNTGLSEGKITNVILQLRDAVVFSHRRGRGVCLPGDEYSKLGEPLALVSESAGG